MRVGGFFLGEVLGEGEVSSFDVVNDRSDGFRRRSVFYLEVARYCKIDDIELKRVVGSAVAQAESAGKNDENEAKSRLTQWHHVTRPS